MRYLDWDMLGVVVSSVLAGTMLGFSVRRQHALKERRMAAPHYATEIEGHRYVHDSDRCPECIKRLAEERLRNEDKAK